MPSRRGGALREFVRPGSSCSSSRPSEAELAVIEAVDALYRPLVDALIEAELDGVEPEPGRRPVPRAAGAGAEMSLLDAAAARAGRGGRRRRRRSGRAARRRPGADRGAQPGGQRDRRDLPGASRGGCSPRPRAVRCTACRWRSRTSGRCPGGRSGSAPREHVGPPPPPGESGPYRALRDAGAVIVGVANMHEYGVRQHRPHLRLRPGPQPLGHRALPGRLVERPRRRGRRPAGQRRGGRRRRRLDPLPGRLLRAHRAEADLRPLDDGAATTSRRRRRSSPGRSAATPPTAGCWAASCSARSWPAGEPDGLRIGVVPGELWDDCDAEVHRGLPRGVGGASRGHRRHRHRGRLRGPRARPDRLDPGRPDRGARRRRRPSGSPRSATTSAWSRGRSCATGCCSRRSRSPRRRGCAPWCGARWPSCSSGSTCSPGRRSRRRRRRSRTRPSSSPRAPTRPTTSIRARAGSPTWPACPRSASRSAEAPRGCRSRCSCSPPWGRDELLLDAAEALERAHRSRAAGCDCGARPLRASSS